jgi:hypothetical protein
MPDFAGATPVIIETKQFYAALYHKDGKRTTTIGSEYLPVTGLTVAMLDTWASAGVGGLSNAGLVEYGGLGVAKRIAIGSALVYDESYGISRALVLVFQKKDTLKTARFSIPAPDAALFIGRYSLLPTTDAEQGARISASLAAYLAILNAGLDPAEQWQFSQGYLDNAPAAVKQLTVVDSQLDEPPAGTPAEEPGE